MFFRKKSQSVVSGKELVIQIQWGGYYTSKEEDKFGLFRLLDFNKDAYQIQIFREKFDHLPSLEEVKELQPFIWHAPLAVGSLLDDEALTLIGPKVLDDEALSGYGEYLKQMDVTESAIQELFQRLIQYSHEAPTTVKLSESSDRTVSVSTQ